jgi:hypothetical protein
MTTMSDNAQGLSAEEIEKVVARVRRDLDRGIVPFVSDVTAVIGALAAANARMAALEEALRPYVQRAQTSWRYLSSEEKDEFSRAARLLPAPEHTESRS